MFKFIVGGFVVLAAFFIFEHATLDEDVVAECERTHPNSLQGQLLCQKRVVAANKAIAKEQAAKQCVDGDEKRMRAVVASIRSEAIAHSGLSLSSLHDTLTKKLPKENFSNQSTSSNPKQMVIVATVKTICDSSYSILTNVKTKNEGNRVEIFSAWENSPLSNEKNQRYLSEFEWVAK